MSYTCNYDYGDYINLQCLYKLDHLRKKEQKIAATISDCDISISSNFVGNDFPFSLEGFSHYCSEHYKLGLIQWTKENCYKGHVFS